MASCPGNWDIILQSGVEEIEVLYSVAECRALTHPERLLLAAARYWYRGNPERLTELIAIAQDKEAV